MMTELSSPEPPENERTIEWFAACALRKVSTSWLDMTSLGLVAEGLKLNIIVWEPCGINQEVQPYSAGSTTGVFFCSAEKDWVHFLYQANEWAARENAVAGSGEQQQQHDHFDRFGAACRR